MIGLILGFVLMGVAYYAQISIELRQIKTEQQFAQAEQLLADVLQTQSGARDQAGIFLQTSQAASREAFQSYIEQLNQALEALARVDFRFFSAQENENVTNSANAFIAQAEAALASAPLDYDSQAISQREGILDNASLTLKSAIDTYRDTMQQSLTRRIAAGADEKSITQWMFGIVLFLTAAGTTIGLFLIYRSIVLPLWHMQSIIAQQNRGVEKARVKIVANDELGNLGRAFNRLLDERIQVLSEKSLENEQLNNSIIGLIRALGMIAKKDLSIKVPVSADVTGTVSDAVNLLTSETARTLHQVRGFSEQINDISDQLQSQSELVMAVAEAERTQVSETITALDQSAKAMNDIAREARVTNSIASAAIDNTLKAQQSVIQTVEGIQIIRGTISETEKRIKRLGDRSQEITSIVNLINTIAERTHILALNASMHAASAGEAGKGFAVVAEEVQRLAENARGATSEISAMVNNIRVETSDTVNIMNKLITQVAEGTKLAEDSGQRMHETEAATRQLVNHVKSIAVSSVNQSNMANRVRDRAITITESTEKTHSALQEQRLQTDELKVCARSLAERVNVFTLPEFRADARNTLVAIRQPAVNEEQINDHIASA
jgi:methyl-accepting chemotaxis protein